VARPCPVLYVDDQRQTTNSGAPDKDAAEQIAGDIETEVALRKRGIIDPTQERFASETARPLTRHVAEHQAALSARGREPRYVAENCDRLRRALELCGAAGIRDLKPAAV
jgi:hypothetical protein